LFLLAFCGIIPLLMFLVSGAVLFAAVRRVSLADETNIA